MKEVMDSIRNSFYEKLKTPFAGSFMVSWATLHWKLLFILFNFDPRHTLEDKLLLINNYLQPLNAWDLLVIPVGYSFAATAAYYLLSNFSYGIVLMARKWMRPAVYKLIDRNELIDNDAYRLLLQRSSKHQEEYSRLEAAYADAREEIKNLKKENHDEKALIAGQVVKIRETEELLQRLKTEAAQKEAMLRKIEEELRFDKERYLLPAASGKKEEELIRTLQEKLKDKDRYINQLLLLTEENEKLLSDLTADGKILKAGEVSKNQGKPK